MQRSLVPDWHGSLDSSVRCHKPVPVVGNHLLHSHARRQNREIGRNSAIHVLGKRSEALQFLLYNWRFEVIGLVHRPPLRCCNGVSQTNWRIFVLTSASLHFFVVATPSVNSMPAFS